MTTATTAPEATTQPTTYELRVIFTVDPSTDEHLHTAQAIRDEVASWLESLNATVERVSVTNAD